MISKILKDHGAVGASAAMTGDRIGELVDLDRRQIRTKVSRERAAGVVICSNGKGYFLPATEDEVAAFVNRMQKGIRSHTTAMNAAKRYLYTLKMEAMGKLPHVEPEDEGGKPDEGTEPPPVCRAVGGYVGRLLEEKK